MEQIGQADDRHAERRKRLGRAHRADRSTPAKPGIARRHARDAIALDRRRDDQHGRLGGSAAAARRRRAPPGSTGGPRRRPRPAPGVISAASAPVADDGRDLGRTSDVTGGRGCRTPAPPAPGDNPSAPRVRRAAAAGRAAAPVRRRRPGLFDERLELPHDLGFAGQRRTQAHTRLRAAARTRPRPRAGRRRRADRSSSSASTKPMSRRQVRQTISVCARRQAPGGP